MSYQFYLFGCDFSGSQISALDPLTHLPIATHCPARKNIDTRYASRDTGAPGDFLVTPGDTGKTLKPRSWENGHVHGISMNITNIKTLSDKTIGFTQLKTKWVYNHQRMEWRCDEPKMGIAHICHMSLYSVVSPYHCRLMTNYRHSLDSLFWLNLIMRSKKKHGLE